LNKNIKIALFVSFFISLIFLAEKSQSARVSNNLFISIKNEVVGEHFLDTNDIKKDLKVQTGYEIKTRQLQDVDLRKMEQVITANNFVADCDISRDIQGNVHLKIQENKPIARITTRNGKGHYLTSVADVLPLSERFTARVVLITGLVTPLTKAGYWQTVKGKAFLDMLNYVYDNDFWRSQISQISVDKNGEITLFQQVGRQQITFGEAENYETKFERLKTFYDKVIPNKGWGKYSKVSVKFDKQIICE
jgi:cell division protein FtsQ